MPELPEVETVKEKLKKLVLNKKISSVDIYWDNIVVTNQDEFKKVLVNKVIKDIKRRGKWLIFDVGNYYLLSHLRMEGKFFLKQDEPLNKHEHVVFNFTDNTNLRYSDTRKFGKMYLVDKGMAFEIKPLSELGLEPNDLNLKYLKEKFSNKRIAIKTVLLDQKIMVGLGNIYVNEVLFLSGVDPSKPAKNLEDEEISSIIRNTREVLDKAIKAGGATIRSYSAVGVKGDYQKELKVHGKEKCSKCGGEIAKIKINGRSSYYCKKCQS